MFYAIASAIKGTLNSRGQTESSYFRHLWQAGVEPKHLAAEEPFRKAVPTAAGRPLALDLQVPMGAQTSLSLQETGFVHGVRGGVHRRKSHQGLSDTKTLAITPQAGAGTREASLYGLPSSQNPPQASSDGCCPTAGGRTAGWTDQLSGHECTVWFPTP